MKAKLHFAALWFSATWAGYGSAFLLGALLFGIPAELYIGDGRIISLIGGLCFVLIAFIYGGLYGRDWDSENKDGAE
jgi:hypothetical protein